MMQRATLFAGALLDQGVQGLKFGLRTEASKLKTQETKTCESSCGECSLEQKEMEVLADVEKVIEGNGKDGRCNWEQILKVIKTKRDTAFSKYVENLRVDKFREKLATACLHDKLVEMVQNSYNFKKEWFIDHSGMFQEMRQSKVYKGLKSSEKINKFGDHDKLRDYCEQTDEDNESEAEWKYQDGKNLKVPKFVKHVATQLWLVFYKNLNTIPAIDNEDKNNVILAQDLSVELALVIEALQTYQILKSIHTSFLGQKLRTVPSLLDESNFDGSFDNVGKHPHVVSKSEYLRNTVQRGVAFDFKQAKLYVYEGKEKSCEVSVGRNTSFSLTPTISKSDFDNFTLDEENWSNHNFTLKGPYVLVTIDNSEKKCSFVATVKEAPYQVKYVFDEYKKKVMQSLTLVQMESKDKWLHECTGCKKAVEATHPSGTSLKQAHEQRNFLRRGLAWFRNREDVKCPTKSCSTEQQIAIKKVGKTICKGSRYNCFHDHLFDSVRTNSRCHCRRRSCCRRACWNRRGYWKCCIGPWAFGRCCGHGPRHGRCCNARSSGRSGFVEARRRHEPCEGCL